MGRPSRVESAIGCVYEAALDSAGWASALFAIAKQVQASTATAIAMNLSDNSINFGALHNIEPARLGEYAQHYMGVDVWNAALVRLPPRRAYFGHLLVDESIFIRSEFYNDFLRPQGIFHALGGFVVRTGTQVFLCGFQRDLGEPQFSMAEGRLVNRLFPHLERAAKLHGSLATAGGLTEGLAAALERLPQAAILVDGSGRIIWANHLGEEQLRRADGIRLRDGRVEAATCTSANQRLLRLIAAAENVSAADSETPPSGPLVRLNRPEVSSHVGLHGGTCAGRPDLGAAKWNGVAGALQKNGAGTKAASANGSQHETARRALAAPRIIRTLQLADVDEAGGLLLLPRSWPLRPLTMTVTPLVASRRKGSVMPGVTRPAALLLVHDPDRTVPLPAERLCRVFGLTPAEAKLAAALAGGSTLGQYADRASIKIGTARWYLKQVLAKTGVHRQSELVRNVLATVGIGAEQDGLLV
jgi:DNA-binding CsgD family transcriptional regulator/PAS domain-containing protein